MGKSRLLFDVVICLVCLLLMAEHSDAWRRRRRRRRSPPPAPPPDTTAPTFSTCAGNLGNQYTTSTTTTVSWATPTATDDRGSVTVSITSGSAPGSRFSEGGHSTVYTARDSAGNTAGCTVSYTVVVIRCSSLPAPSHGTVGCTNSRYVSSSCTYSCSTGYRLASGSTSRTCTRSGNSAYWSGSAATCARVTCGAQSNPSHGTVSCTDSAYYNSRCTYSCNSGYTLQGGASTVCGATGHWSNPAPTCADTHAPVFSQCPSSLTIYAPPLATSGTVTWTIPRATDNSGETITPEQSLGPDRMSSVPEGVHPISYSASDSAGNAAIACSFSVTVAVIRCAARTATAPLQVSCPHGNIRGSVCTYTCATGYKLQGQGSTECQKSGSSGAWSNSAPTCQILQCPALSAPVHGGIIGSCSRNYDSSCSFGCAVGYEISGSSTVRCVVHSGGSSAVWNAQPPVCSRIYCSKPALTTALQITTTAACPAGNIVYSGHQCQFSCSTGYYLTGNAALTCQHDRTWSDSTPTCSLISCAASQLPAPANAEKRGCPNSREDYGTACSLVCNVGYLPTTPAVRTCSDDGNGDADGVWSGPELTCNIVMCPVPPLTSDGAITGCVFQGASQSIDTQQKYSTTCAHSCDEGFTQTGGSANRVCQADGGWDGTQIICQDTTPPVFECPSDQLVWAGSGSTSASVPWSDWEPLMGTDRGDPLQATLFSIDGVAVAMVTPDSLTEGVHRLIYRGPDLAGNTGSCSFDVQVQVTRCPPLHVPSHGLLALDDGQATCVEGPLYGAVCPITCEDGYQLSVGSDSAVRTCERSNPPSTLGFWSGDGVTCLVKNCSIPEVTNGGSRYCTSEANVPYQMSCQFNCDPGYMAPSGAESVLRTCQADESWDGDDLQCTVAKTCPALFVIPQGSVTPPQCGTDQTVVFGTECEFSCQAGFQLQSGLPVTILACSTEGEWSSNVRPQCQDVQPPSFSIQCPLLIPVEAERGTRGATVDYEEPVGIDNSGQVNVTRLDPDVGPGTIFQEGDTTLGYLATDSSGLTARCDVIISVTVQRCPAQQPPSQGAVQGCEDPIHGSQCAFSCLPGYSLVGEAVVSCDLSGDGSPQWSHDAPICQIKTCPALAVEPPATLTGCAGQQDGAVPYGSVCTFHCPFGYQGDGEENEKRCQADATWTSTDFNCQRTSCPPLAATGAISIAPSSCLRDPVFEDTCRLQCITPGFEVQPAGLVETTCTGSQTWTDDILQAQCVDVVLPSFDQCPDSFVVYTERQSDSADVHWVVTATDNSGIDPTVTCDLEPGVMTYGRYVVTCSATDDTGLRNECRFTVDVIVRQCPEELQPPMFGTLTGPCDRSHGSVCHVTCLVGYELVGSSEVSCEYNGAAMHWYAEEEPHCEVIGCLPLTFDPSVSVSPLSCVTSVKVHASTVCTLHCQDDLVLTGAEPGVNVALVCQTSGEWMGELNNTVVRCVDRTPPTILSCPSQPITAIRTEFSGVMVTFEPPTATDNVDNAADIMVATFPPDLTSPYEFISDMTCSYIFTDFSDNSALCIFQVDIENQVQPLVSFCPPGQNITTPTEITEVEWEVPQFQAAPGTRVIETCNYGDSPAQLPWGHHTIQCQARDYESGLTVECRIDIDITPDPCHTLRTPANGGLACDDGFAYERYCTMVCNGGYDIPRLSSNLAPEKLFVCGTSGRWYPHSNVPDCSAVRRPNRLNLPLSIMYLEGHCSGGVSEVNQDVAERFISIITQTSFAQICTQNQLCTTENIQVTCGPELSRRRRRAAGLDMGEGEDTSQGDVMMVSMLVSLVPHEGTNHTGTMKALAQHIHWQTKTMALGGGGRIGRYQPSLQDSVLQLDDIFVECEDGYIPDHQQQTCIACPRGHYFDRSSVQCVECTVGYYQDQEGQTSCQPCPSGTWTTGTGAREPSACMALCQAGQYSPSGLGPCTLCPLGTYQENTQQKSCSACPRGQTTRSPGAQNKQDCFLLD